MKNIMTKIAKVVLFLAALFMASCQKDYEKIYDLSVDAHEYLLSAEGRQFHIYVYCSGAWTAEFDVEQDWLTIVPGTEAGSGVGVIRLEASYNDVEVRDVNLIIRSGEFTQTIHISQKYDSTHWVIN